MVIGLKYTQPSVIKRAKKKNNNFGSTQINTTVKSGNKGEATDGIQVSEEQSVKKRLNLTGKVWSTLKKKLVRKRIK